MVMRCNQKGVSLIAAVFIIVILGFMGVMFVSLISTGSMTSVNDLQSMQALYVAEGGIEYTLVNKVFPNYAVSPANLGAGSFSVATPSSLNGGISATSTTPIVVNATPSASFPASNGRIVIDSEVIAYGTWDGSTTFTTITRGVGGTTAAAHANDNAVYPVTTVSADPGLADPASISVASATGFGIPGIINIGNENMYCTGTNAPATQFTNCRRAYNGTAAAAHAAGSHVFQYAFSSTGTVGPAQRVVRADMTSRIRNTNMSWSWAPSKDWVLEAFSIKPAAGGAIAFDASASATFKKTDAPPFQWPHTAGAGASFLYVGLAVGNVVSLAPATNVTYAGQNLTYLDSIDHANNTIRVEIWYLSNPVTGTNNVVVTIPAGNEFVGGSASFTGVDQAKPVDAPVNFAQGTGSLAAVNVLVTTPNSYVVDVLSQVATPNTTPGPGQTAGWQNLKVGGTLGAGSYSGPLFSAAAGDMKVTTGEMFR